MNDPRVNCRGRKDTVDLRFVSAENPDLWEAPSVITPAVSQNTVLLAARMFVLRISACFVHSAQAPPPTPTPNSILCKSCVVSSRGMVM